MIEAREYSEKLMCSFPRVRLFSRILKYITMVFHLDIMLEIYKEEWFWSQIDAFRFSWATCTHMNPVILIFHDFIVHNNAFLEWG